MKKSNLLKSVVVIALSILLIANLVTVVFADDNTFGWDTPTAITNTSTTNNTVDNTTTNTTANTTANTTNDLYNSTITTGNATTTLNTSINETENEVNTLAYTGIENNSILIVVILVGAMVAGYSLKKIKEYNI